MTTYGDKGFLRLRELIFILNRKVMVKIYYYCMLELQIRACGIKNSIYYQKNIE
ncbi:hypothetical protein SSP1900 [Staphylococcus saprophyticus subsp. saprophyticus ATCC 15305]|uniref:Uncharacterized protein n=1 Tax=Staphylococcus saprophyticus subsp. saprophyticus (strain ATCC 15305 / DSM 20229 / NCIMB 8711 / NCTC 7292 / S-41) TaxID=342451 RepID=Q49W15_STAS1|nr:hypothetical protein SSP1900 [Staphylococcus saprophyticus subsp. saprophyticus ATCC 15305] [Staphylococcus saprophyticus subsp. saprophyticus ATCC 15305 = NCTC 7292]